MLEDVVGVIRVSEVLNVGESMSRPYPFPVNGSTPADDALMRQIVPQRNVVISTGTPSLFFRRGVVSIPCSVVTILIYFDTGDEPRDDVATSQQTQKLCDILDTLASDRVCRSNKLDVLGGSDVLDRAVHAALSCP